jgi:hypothetical protein
MFGKSLDLKKAKVQIKDIIYIYAYYKTIIKYILHLKVLTIIEIKEFIVIIPIIH